MPKPGRSCRRPRGSRSGVAGPADCSDLVDLDTVGVLFIKAAEALCLIKSPHAEIDRQGALDDLGIRLLGPPAGRASAVDELLVELDGLPARGHTSRVPPANPARSRWAMGSDPLDVRTTRRATSAGPVDSAACSPLRNCWADGTSGILRGQSTMTTSGTRYSTRRSASGAS